VDTPLSDPHDALANDAARFHACTFDGKPWVESL
jgi:hypothetical protein